jgi:hypothetical protein
LEKQQFEKRKLGAKNWATLDRWFILPSSIENEQSFGRSDSLRSLKGILFSPKFNRTDL